MVRAAAAAALAAAFVVPLARRRLRIPAGVTVAATAAGPFALAVLFPRTKGRDAGLFALQMWAFTVIHELPYDQPDRLRERLRVRYPIRVDRLLGAGELPNVRLQRAFSRPGEVTKLDRVLAMVHWAWFIEPHLALTWILLRNQGRFPRAARQMGAAFDIGCAIYFAVPTAPPWWAAEEGYISEEAEVAGEPRERGDRGRVGPAPAAAGDGRGGGGDLGPRLAGPLLLARRQPVGGDALPPLRDLGAGGPAPHGVGAGRRRGRAGRMRSRSGSRSCTWGSTTSSTCWSGTAVVVAVRRGEPLARPLADRVSRLAQRLERIANG